MRIKGGCLAVFAALALAGLKADLSFAINSSTREDEDSAAGVRYYEPSKCSLNDSLSVSKTDAEATAGLSKHQSEWVDRWHETAQQLSIEFGIPWEAVMAQSIIESGAGTSYYATTRNNFFGLGAVDSNPDNAFSYASPEAGWRGYYEFIQRNSSLYSAHGVFAEPTITNPYKYLEAIKAAGYATAPDHVASVSEYIEAVETRAKTLDWALSSDLAKSYPSMLENATKNRAGESKTDTANFVGDDCNCSATAGTSGIRWESGYMVASSLPGYSRAEVLGTSAENKITSLGYGLSFTTKSPKDNNNGPDKVVLEFVAPVDTAAGYVSNSLDLYSSGNFPHFTVDLRNKRVYQHFSAKLSSAAMGSHNRDGGIVVAVVGYIGDKNDGSTWNLEKNADESSWSYLATILKGIHEQYSVSLQENAGEAALWNKIAPELADARDESSNKCASLSDSDLSLSEAEAKKIASYYNSNAVTVADYNLPAGTKKNCVSFVAYFVQRFTSVGKVNRVWGNGRDTAYFLKQSYPNFGTGTDPKPMAVFSVTQGTTYCGAEKCGHTGIVVAIENGNVTTIEAAYPDTLAEVKTRPLSYFANSAHPYQFTYLSTEINEDELALGKQGK
jgi:hypothetical protein